MTRVYLDASALVKLVLRERETHALESAIRDAAVCYTNVIGRIELERAVRRESLDEEGHLESVVARTEQVPLNVAIVAAAGVLPPRSLRSLDAIHLATLLAMRDEVDAFYCYDQRLADAAREHGIDVRSPGLAA